MMMSRIETAFRKLLDGLTRPPVVLCILALALLPLLYAGRYNHPSIDDFDNAQWTSYWPMQAQLYMRWTGRYFSSLLVTLIPLHWDSWTGYRIAAGALILAFSSLTFLAVMRLLEAATDLPARKRWLVAAGCVVLYFNNTASLEEGFYWFTGAFTYTSGAMLFTGFLLLCLRLHRQPADAQLQWSFSLAALLLICVIGSNESIIPLPFLACGALWYYYRRTGRQKLARLYLWLLPICALAATAALLAPGNAVRQNGLPRNLFIAGPSWLYFSKEVFLEWISEPVFLLCSVIFLVLARRLRLRWRMPLWVAFLIPLLIICVTLLPGYYALGRMPPYRVQNVAYLFFLFSWLLFLAQLAERLCPLWNNDAAQARLLRQLVAVAVIIGLLASFKMEHLRITSNYFALAKGLAKGQLRAYDAEMEARYAQIRQTRGDTVILAPIRNRRGNVLYFADINYNPNIFPNVTYAKFWGKGKIWIDTAGKYAK